MIYILTNILIFIVILLIIRYLKIKKISFGKRVMISLLFGIIYGYILNFLYGNSSQIIKITTDWFNIVGRGYVALLSMLVIPLIFISVLSAFVKLKDTKEITKNGSLVISTLLITAAIASVVAIFVSLIFKLNANNILKTDEIIKAGERILSLQTSVDQTFPQKIIDFIPKNPIADLANLRKNSAIATVIFSSFIGFAILGIKNKKSESAEFAIKMINTSNDIIMKMVSNILKLTPYGIFALITNVLATTNYTQIYNLITFVLASYIAIIIMFIIHLLIVTIFGTNPVYYIKSVSSTLLFAFTSRSSIGTLPMTINVQKEKLNVDDGIANLAGTFGTSIGQNGCAAIYPTMLAMMIAPTIGIEFSFIFLAKLVLIVVISSLGVAGVGGGATFAAIIVLSSLGFPIELAGLLISVEPLIDMGRTALNVNDSIVAGVVSNKIIKK